MWWKLALLAIATLSLVGSIIPIRTHAVMFDPLRDQPPQPTWGRLIANMYLTPGTTVAIVVILLIAAAIAYKIMRG